MISHIKALFETFIHAISQEQCVVWETNSIYNINEVIIEM